MMRVEIASWDEGPLIVSQRSGTIVEVLEEPFRFTLDFVDMATRTFEIPKGAESDGSSPGTVPVLRAVVRLASPRRDAHPKAIWIHDWFYRTQPEGVTRLLADQALKAAMKREGVGMVKRNVKYSVVRALGCVGWERNRRRMEKVKSGITR